MSDAEILERLNEIVPDWRRVDLTKKGYTGQYVITLVELLKFIRELEGSETEEYDYQELLEMTNQELAEIIINRQDATSEN